MRPGRVASALVEALGVAALWIPGGIGSRLRRTYYRLRGARFGARTRIEVGVIIDNPRYVRIGADSWLDRYAIIIAGPPGRERETRLKSGSGLALPGEVRIGDRCHIGVSTILSGIGGLSIGDDVTVAAGSKVYSLTHHYRSWSRPADRSVAFGSMGPREHQSMLQGEVTIGSNVGIGVECLILPGVRIERASFVRPRSVVSGNFPENSLIAGDPARREGDRFQPDAS